MEPPRDGNDTADTSRFIISGHQVDVGDALREHAMRGLSETASKYFDGAEDASVTFSRTGKGGFACNLRFHAGRGLFFDSHGEHEDAYVAFNQALERVAKQLRRRKRELREDKPANPARQGVL
jgi:ribosomal subunit interface protein